MISSIELQVISRILRSDDPIEIDELCAFDSSYYSIYRDQIEFILNHRQKYNNVPDIFTFQAEFPDIQLVTVNEGLAYFKDEMKLNKQHIILIETFNKIRDLGTGDTTTAWQYLSDQCNRVAELDNTLPLDIVKDVKERSNQIIEFSKQARIPTGFDEIDKLMYGGLSTVEELLLIVARTNTGKSWVCTKLMESAQSHGFPSLYYSPEMQGAFLGTRFDTWRGHFKNNILQQGKYSDEYLDYVDVLKDDTTSAFVLEDKDVEEGEVNVTVLRNIVKRHGIKLLIIDGLSYMADVRKSDSDYVKYKNICLDLFKLSKQFGCAVVVAMQANRETRDQKDDKGEPFPNLYNVEGSDHPARIATQAFALRQVFDKHVLDIRLEKSRNAANQKPVLSYAWDVNTGNMQYIPGDDDDLTSAASPTVTAMPGTITSHQSPSDSTIYEDEFDDDDVEF